MNAVGMNTAHSTSAMAMIGPDTSSIALRVASIGSCPSAMWRSTFSTTTIASSTTMPMARTRPKSESVFSEKPISEHHGKGADQRDRHRDERDDRRAPRLQEHHDDDGDEQDGFEKRLDHRLDRLAHEDRRVVHDAVVHALGERLPSAWP